MSYYQILNVDPRASDEDVKKAYRTLAIKFHPDHNPHNRELSNHRFHLITEAYSKIKTRQQRLDYNNWLKAQSEQQKPANNNRSWLDRFFGSPKAAQ